MRNRPRGCLGVIFRCSQGSEYRGFGGASELEIPENASCLEVYLSLEIFRGDSESFMDKRSGSNHHVTPNSGF